MSSCGTAPLVKELGVVLNHRTPPISIEILPGDIDAWVSDGSQNFLLVEGNLGIPHKVLYRAYKQAVPDFHSIQGSLRALRRKDFSKEDPTFVDKAIYSSSVLLLTNPAHQTALNARKQLVIADRIAPGAELGFTAALLTLQDCSKQSIIWHHRRWVLRRIGTFPEPPRERLDSSTSIADEDTLHSSGIPLKLLVEELSIASKAATKYPRNYFAWNHRTRVFDALVASARRAVARPDTCDLTAWITLVTGERKWAEKWVEGHISDYTAMQYLCRVSFTEQRLQADTADVVQWDSLETKNDVTAIHHAASLLEVYPDYESLWLYLRLAAKGEEVFDLTPVVNRAIEAGTSPDRTLEFVKKVEVNSTRFQTWRSRQREVA